MMPQLTKNHEIACVKIGSVRLWGGLHSFQFGIQAAKPVSVVLNLGWLALSVDHEGTPARTDIPNGPGGEVATVPGQLSTEGVLKLWNSERGATLPPGTSLLDSATDYLAKLKNSVAFAIPPSVQREPDVFSIPSPTSFRGGTFNMEHTK